jgi:phage tail-like protein
MPRYNVQIEMIDINGGAPQQVADTVTGTRVWQLTNAWVTKYNAPDLNALQSEVAIESVELAYEELIIPN